MQRGINAVTIMGNLGKKPEMRYTPNGKAVTTFSVAVNESWGSDESQKSTEWFNVEAWNKQAEIINEHFDKGDPIYVEGRQKTDKYDKDGVTHYRSKIVMKDFRFLPKGDGNGAGEAEPEGEEVSFGEG